MNEIENVISELRKCLPEYSDAYEKFIYNMMLSVNRVSRATHAKIGVSETRLDVEILCGNRVLNYLVSDRLVEIRYPEESTQDYDITFLNCVDKNRIESDLEILVDF